MAFNPICPGSISIKSPTPEYHQCPNCNYEVEIWSDEVKTNCPNCKTVVFREKQPSCIDWCKFAKECFGTELYSKAKGIECPEGAGPSAEGQGAQ